jgi:hypothetical protein
MGAGNDPAGGDWGYYTYVYDDGTLENGYFTGHLGWNNGSLAATWIATDGPYYPVQGVCACCVAVALSLRH